MWFGHKAREAEQIEKHGTLAEDTQVGEAWFGTLIAEETHEEEAKDVKSMEIGKSGSNSSQNSTFGEMRKKTRVSASSQKVQIQPASPKQLDAQLLESKAAPSAISLAQSTEKEKK